MLFSIAAAPISIPTRIAQGLLLLGILAYICYFLSVLIIAIPTGVRCYFIQVLCIFPEMDSLGQSKQKMKKSVAFSEVRTPYLLLLCDREPQNTQEVSGILVTPPTNIY